MDNGQTTYGTKVKPTGCSQSWSSQTSVPGCQLKGSDLVNVQQLSNSLPISFQLIAYQKKPSTMLPTATTEDTLPLLSSFFS